MGNIIANLLSTDEVNFNSTIGKLERNSGNPSVDVQLMSEIIQATRLKVPALGLDSDDCTGEELYYALMAKAKLHDGHLAKHIGSSQDDSVDKIALAIKNVIDKSRVNQKVWVLKKSVVKRLLHNEAPHEVMRFLNYSSVDSLTKRESLAEIFGAIRLLESDQWLKRFNKQYSKLLPSDFEERDIELLVMPSQRWSELSNKLYDNQQYSLTHLKELGFVVIFAPKSQKLDGYTLSTLPLVLHYLNEIKLYSAFFKLQQVRPDFGKIIVRTLNEDDIYDIEISGKKIHWRVVQKYYGSNKSVHPDVFQPYIQKEDLAWQSTSRLLYQIDPELKFWEDFEYVGALLGSNQPISFNILDVSMNYYFALSYNDRLYSKMQSSLWNELYSRYLVQSVYASQVQNQLSYGSVNLDQLRF